MELYFSTLAVMALAVAWILAAAGIFALNYKWSARRSLTTGAFSAYAIHLGFLALC